MAVDMKSGRWDENGETIKFDVKDQLVDGQNRLMACIKADAAFTSVVVYGVKSDLNIDTGSKRALKQWLKHHGVEQYSCDVASSVRCLLGMQTGAFSSSEANRATNHELLKTLKQHPQIKDSVVRIQAVKSALCAASIIAPLHYLFAQKDEALAEKFIQGLENKIELRNTDPVIMLREKLLSDKGAKLKMSKRGKCALVIIAWNHWRNGTTTKLLKFTESGPTRMEFPNIE